MTPLTCRGQKLKNAQKAVIAISATVTLLSSAAPSQANAFQIISDFKGEAQSKPPAWINTTYSQSSPVQLEATQLEPISSTQAEPAGWARLRERLLSEPDHEVARSMPSVPVSGTYLYGQQPIANQPGTTYFIFEAQGNHISGAFFMPSSSFDCVEGHIEGQQLALTVTDSYLQDTYAYALTLTAPSAQIASQQGIEVLPSIEGFHQIPVSDGDRAILATCQAPQ